MLSRRDLVGKLAAGTAAVWVAGRARISLARARREVGPGSEGSGPAESQKLPASAPQLPGAGPQVVDSGPPATLSAPPPWELLRPLTLGSLVAHGWRVAGLTGVVDGSCVLTLQNERSRAHRVHLCRNDGSPQGLVHTKQLDLVVMNGGQGDVPTDEGFAQAVAEVAHALAANEGDRRLAAVTESLLPHAERVRLFAGPADRRLR
jgi:hypothetical protein